MITLYDKNGEPHEFEDAMETEVMNTGCYTRITPNLGKPKEVLEEKPKKSKKLNRE